MMPVTTIDEKDQDTKPLTAEEFGRQLKVNGDLAVNFRTGTMFKSIMRAIFRDVTSGFGVSGSSADTVERKLNHLKR